MTIKKLILRGFDRDTAGDEDKPLLLVTGATLNPDTSLDDARESQAYIVDADIALELTLSKASNQLFKDKKVKYFEWDDQEYKFYRFIKRNDLEAYLYGQIQGQEVEIQTNG